jgi:4-cresol dehydrogenase (hydroxylating)
LLRLAAEIVGADHVVLPGSDPLGERYSDPYSFNEAFAQPPAGAILPATVNQVQELVRAAGRVGASLWTVSQGRNLAYGGAAPVDPDCVVLDLSRMSAVKSVDVDECYAVVEPGVSFFGLFEHLRAMGAPMMMSVPDLGYGSVLGNALERGFGYTALGDHANSLCGFEVVLPNGELVRTGMGALAGSSTTHLYKPGFGPSLDGLFYQSNLGIVVSVGVWLAPRPAAIASCLVPAPDPAQLVTLVDNLRPLMLDRTIDSVVIVGNVLALAAHRTSRAQISPASGPLPVPALRGIAAKMGVGYWNAKFGLYGRPEVVDAKVGAVRAAVGAAGLDLIVARYAGDVAPGAVHPKDRGQLGIPSGDAIAMAAWRGGAVPAHIDFSLLTPTTGAAAQRVFDLVRAEIEAAGLDHVGGLTMFGRHAVMLSLLSFDRSDPDDCARIDALFARLLQRSAEAGVAPYRAHIRFMDQVAAVYDFGGSAERRVVTAIKRALDPGDVLSPGKQGIRAGERRVPTVPDLTSV